MTIRPRPSSAHMWFYCDAQPLMASNAPIEEPGDPAREGTCAAWVAEMVLTGVWPSTVDGVGESHANGWLVTPDMAQHIQKYVDLVRSYGGEIHTERKVVLNSLVEGTPDAFAVLTPQRILFVDDLKYGFDPVEPYRNHQISIYAGAILRLLTARGTRIDKVVIGVYQPRSWHPAGIHRKWTCFPEELMSFVKAIEEAAVRTQAPNPPATAGGHCEYCPAAATCFANTHANYHIYERSCAKEQRHMTAQEMAEELKFLDMASDMLKGRQRAVTAEAEARIKRGEFIPGFHLEERRGNRQFKYSADVIRALTGVDPEIKKMVTPAEFERMGVNTEILKRLTDQPRIPPKIKPVNTSYYANLFAAKDKK